MIDGKGTVGYKSDLRVVSVMFSWMSDLFLLKVSTYVIVY